MKLYYSKGTCSFSVHIVLSELGLDYQLEPVNLAEKKLKDGSDYRAINPRGYVPYLVDDEGVGHSECGVIVQYLADQHPEAGLAPPNGTPDRYRLQEWLSFIGAELHKTLPALFLPYIPDDYRPVARNRVTQRLQFLDGELKDRQYLMGDDFSVADAYAHAILNWTVPGKFDLAPMPNVKAYHERIGARPAVKKAAAEA